MNRELLAQIIDRLSNVISQMTPEQRQANQSVLSEIIQSIRTHAERLVSGGTPVDDRGEGGTPVVPSIARELWTLANGDRDIFELYMRQYPDEEMNAIAQNPSQLDSIINLIANSQSLPNKPTIDGIPPAPLQSSNVYGYRYDPSNQRLTVRFNEGGVYRYDGVPNVIWDMFRAGAGTARTTGKNKFGRWWRGKVPSSGAALNQLIKMGGYPYTRIK